MAPISEVCAVTTRSANARTSGRFTCFRADLAIATEAITTIDGLITLPCYQWEHVVVVAPDHPLLKSKSVTLEEIAAYPVITYDGAFAGRSKIDHAFSLRGMKPDILLEATAPAVDGVAISTLGGVAVGDAAAEVDADAQDEVVAELEESLEETEEHDLFPYQAIVLTSFGGPEGPEEVMPFLRRVTGGPDGPPCARS